MDWWDLGAPCDFKKFWKLDVQPEQPEPNPPAQPAAEPIEPHKDAERKKPIEPPKTNKRKRQIDDGLDEEQRAKLARKTIWRCGPCPWPLCSHVIRGGAKAHGRIHTQSRPFKCDSARCGLAFKTRDKLLNHKSNHQGESPYQCDRPGCRKKFTQKHNLKSHMNTHEFLKPHKCDQSGCNKAFASSGNLWRHKLRHSGEKHIKCDWTNCHRTFVDPTDFVRHKLRHAHERPYKCSSPDCYKAFTTSGELKLHKFTHTNQRPHKCDFPMCEYAAVTSAHVRDHFKRVHTPEGEARQKKKENRLNLALKTEGITIDRREDHFPLACTGGTYFRFDFIVYKEDCVQMIECQEEQHKRKASVACDFARGLDVEQASRLNGETRPIAFYFFNPDAFKVDGKTFKKQYTDRVKQLVHWLQEPKLRPKDPLTFYLFNYDRNGDRACLLDDPEFPSQIEKNVKTIVG